MNQVDRSQETYRRTDDFRDIVDGYHELEGNGQAMTLKFIGEELGIHRKDLVRLVGEVEKLPGWNVNRCGPTSADIWIQKS